MFESDDNIYKTLYYFLFNSMSEALEKMYQQDFSNAGLHLQLAQRKAEEMYMLWEDEQEKK
ncbi:MAG: hypothetical protein HFG45_04010 [Oscillospiraceae bacterium]|jgi:hypothetical protein|nr:hypothetical protein [Oscillospiraceae bacterium]